MLRAVAAAEQLAILALARADAVPAFAADGSLSAW